MTLNLLELPSFEDAGQDRGKILIHGSPGTGKTTLATSVAEKWKTLYLYFPGEQGLRSIPGSVRKNITPVFVQDIDTMNDLLWQLQTEQHPFDAVVIEGQNSWQSMYIRHVQNLPENAPRSKEQREARRKKAVDMRRIGGDVKTFFVDDLTFWYSLADHTQSKPIHVVMTSQSKRHEIREKTEDPNATGALLEEFIAPDLFPSLANAAEATPDYIGYTFLEDEGLGESDFRYCVRFGPHDLIRTKMRQDVESRRKWPDVVGQDGKRLTLPKFFKFHGIE